MDGDRSRTRRLQAGEPMNTAQVALTFPASAFVPVVLGFFGLGTGYLIYGPQELLGFPKTRTARGPSQRRVGPSSACG